MEIGTVALFSIPPPLAPHSAGVADTAKEFDTLLFEQLLKHSGMLRSFAMDDSAHGAIFGDLIIRQLAQELASSMEPGFARSLFEQNQINRTGEGADG
jgi:Rod binding domain-containing protein